MEAYGPVKNVIHRSPQINTDKKEFFFPRQRKRLVGIRADPWTQILLFVPAKRGKIGVD